MADLSTSIFMLAPGLKTLQSQQSDNVKHRHSPGRLASGVANRAKRPTVATAKSA